MYANCFSICIADYIYNKNIKRNKNKENSYCLKVEAVNYKENLNIVRCDNTAQIYSV